ncbi:MAG: site-2 protease family protein [Treponema sp.]|nr:site-2 protease family protein [Candidatus Treponema scatequi]
MVVLEILIGLLGLSLLVFFHELGHFIFAKIFGVKVLSFSIGMGPILAHKEINGTDYRISAIPLGGYCGMEGEKDFQNAIENNLSVISDDPHSLYGVHPAKRALIAFAGPLFNFIIAILFFTVISMVGYEYYSYTNEIVIDDTITESPARDAGMQTGDKIIKINNVETTNFNEVREEIVCRPKEQLTVVVDRNGEILTFKVTTLINKEMGNGVLGIYPNLESEVKLEAPTYSFFPAIYHGTKDCINMVGQTLKSLTILFKGVDVTKASRGPAGITYMLGSSVTETYKINFRAGLYTTLEFLALISISLGVMNLLPIPILDGGLILFAIIAIIFRKEVPAKIQQKVQLIGLAFIVFLLFIGVTGDVRYFIDIIKNALSKGSVAK